ncbi:MAG: hypothetical protein JJU12_07880 [Chlamydiales bacterium]|nr:hypothetical protein [Chlamydiales bacterium]
MNKSKQEFPDEQLDNFLMEFELDSTCNNAEEPSTESLIEEILELEDSPPSSPASPSLPSLPLNEEGKKKEPRLSMWITSILLSGLLTGAVFGYLWAKSQGVLEKSIVESREEISTQISYWIRELTNLYEKLEPPPAENEIIKPLLPPEELEILAPSEMT